MQIIRPVQLVVLAVVGKTGLVFGKYMYIVIQLRPGLEVLWKQCYYFISGLPVILIATTTFKSQPVSPTQIA